MADKAASAYRTISEAGKETGLPAHVLRFWESKFSQLRPVKRAGGRRLYRPQDISLVLALKHLLYEEGFTIKGAQKYLKDHGVTALIDQVEQGAGPQLAAPITDAEASQAESLSQDDTGADASDEAPLFASANVADGDKPLADAQKQRLLEQLSQAKAALDAVRRA